MSGISSMLIVYINNALPAWGQKLILQKNCHEHNSSLQGSNPERSCQGVISVSIASTFFGRGMKNSNPLSTIKYILIKSKNGTPQE